MIRPIILFLFFAWTSVAAEKWVRASTPNFELYTPLSERSAREKVLYFEQLREFMSKSTGAIAQDSRIPVRIILFQSEKQFEPYRPNEVTAAYYTSGLDRDYIAIGGSVKGSERVAVHEYVHLIARHAKLNFPVWLNEGFADLYSNLQPQRNEVLVGSPIALANINDPHPKLLLDTARMHHQTSDRTEGIRLLRQALANFAP